MHHRPKLQRALFFTSSFIVTTFIGCNVFRESSREVPRPHIQLMKASYYGSDFAGRKTANGEIFSPSALTAAHKTLPFDSVLEVENPQNGKKVRVRINDRGPFVKGRDLDLSHGAAKELALEEKGIAEVAVRRVK